MIVARGLGASVMLTASTVSAQATVPSPAKAEVAHERSPAVEPSGPASAGAPAPAEEKRRAQISGAPGQGLTIAVDDAFSLNIKTRFQLRYQWNARLVGDGKSREHESLVSIGTARVYLSGHAYTPKLLYTIQLAVAGRDFRDGATSPIFDAFFDWKIHRDLNVKAGQYFVPFDRLRTTREFALQMADRPIPVGELTLDRDAGVTFYSQRFLGTPLGWHLGAFGGGGTNQVAGKDFGGMLVGRLELRPFGPIDDDSEGDLERRRRPGLALGAGVASNWNTNRLRSTTGPAFVGGTTDYRHTAVDAVFKWSGFSLQAEYLRKRASTDTILGTDESGEPLTEHTRSAHGWIVQTSYAFDPPFEVVGRLSRLTALRPTDPALVKDVDPRGQEVGAGLNYYLNGHKLKIQGDWIARMPPTLAFDRADHVVHLQLDATL